MPVDKALKTGKTKKAQMLWADRLPRTSSNNYFAVVVERRRRIRLLPGFEETSSS